jgi:hypothetical protein
MGGLHAWRLLLIVLSSGLLIVHTSPEQWVSGLRPLLRPLRFIAVDEDRIAARIWLTLHFAARHEGGIATLFNRLDASPANVPRNLRLPAASMAVRDYILLFSFILFAAAAVW